MPTPWPRDIVTYFWNGSKDICHSLASTRDVSLFMFVGQWLEIESLPEARGVSSSAVLSSNSENGKRYQQLKNNRHMCQKMITFIVNISSLQY
jgi:hypothetical protein